MNETLAKIARGEQAYDDVTESAKVTLTVFKNAVATTIVPLMCDEIIKAGKPIKEDKLSRQ